jgi:hypothetical protein
VLRNIGREIAGSLRLDARELDHLGPFLGILDDVIAELGAAEQRDELAPSDES